MAWAWADPIRRAAQAAAREHGIEVVELAGWRERGHGRTQGQLLGTMWHDTVTTSGMSRRRLFELLRDGYKSLPGPIANVGLDRDGTLGLIAAGRAYHAGSGSWPGIPSGNLNTCGIETANAGKGSGERPTPIQLAVGRTFTAVLHAEAALAASRLVGHKEWAPSRKVDPWAVDMPAERDRLDGPSEEDTMGWSSWVPGRIRKWADEVRGLTTKDTRHRDPVTFEQMSVVLYRLMVDTGHEAAIAHAAELKRVMESVDSNPGYVKFVVQHLRDTRGGGDGGPSLEEVLAEADKRYAELGHDHPHHHDEGRTGPPVG